MAKNRCYTSAMKHQLSSHTDAAYGVSFLHGLGRFWLAIVVGMHHDSSSGAAQYHAVSLIDRKRAQRANPAR